MDELSDPFADTPYRTLGLLGAGGAARVYEVEHRAIGKRLVAKLLHASLADDPVTVARLNREGKALVTAAHPHLVEVLDFAYTDEGVPYLVMERLVGCDLRQEISRVGALPVLEALRYTQQALSALETAHRAHVVHRDLKPENIFLHQLPSGERIVKVLDLGLAKIGVLAGRLAEGLEDGALVGTPNYMAPEVISDREADARSDVYAMGAVLYEALVGSGPFDHLESRMRILQAHLDAVPERPSLRAGRRLRVLDAVVMKALAKDPASRWQSAAEFEAALKRLETDFARALNPALVLISMAASAALTFTLLRALFQS